jgi:hypothetical protein
LLLLPKKIWLMKQSNMGCGLYFKAFTAYRFYKVNLKVEKIGVWQSSCFSASPCSCEKSTVVVQHATPLSRSSRVVYKIVWWPQVYWCQRYLLLKRITTLQIYTWMVAKWLLLSKHWNILRASWSFVRIHNSYIVNSRYISRIHTGNAVCYIKNTTVKIPFLSRIKLMSILYFRNFQRNYLEI